MILTFVTSRNLHSKILNPPLYTLMATVTFYRKRLELETRQAIRNAKEKTELDRLAFMEEKGLELVSRLVRTGRFEESELAGALRVLFPRKTTADIDDLLDKVYHKAARQQRTRFNKKN